MKKLNGLYVFSLALPLAVVACGDDSGDGDPMADAAVMFDARPNADAMVTPPDEGFRTDAPAVYTRVDRMGLPAISTALISGAADPPVSKNDYNDDGPAEDIAGDHTAEIVTNLTAIHAALDDDLVAATLVPCMAGGSCVTQGAPIIVPDTLKINVGNAAGYPNGRGLADQAMDLTLAVALLDLAVEPVTTFAELPLNPTANDVAFSDTFPYLAAPHTP